MSDLTATVQSGTTLVHGLPLMERLSYAAGNFGINLLFGMTGAYLLYFYTDVYRVAPGFVAMVFLLARGIDAMFDPLLGLLIDRTSTRFGKHRPYLLALMLPYAVCGAAVFAAPALTGTAKAAYILLSYTLLGILYSGVSLPLNSMLPTLTRDPATRTSTNVLREFFGSGATVGVGYVTLPLVALLGAGSAARGFFRLAAIFGVIAVACLLLTFSKVRERVAPDARLDVLTTRQSLRAARGNVPWVATMLVNFCWWIGFISHVQSTVYYVDNLMAAPAQVSTIMATLLAAIVGTGMAGLLAHRVGKPRAGMVGCIIATAATCALALSAAPGWQIALNIVAYFGLGLVGGLLFALMADAVDYGEWKNGIRAQGFLYAASSLGVKLGMSIGGAAGAWLLARSGYVAGVAATPAVSASIIASYVWFPALSYAAMGLGLLAFRFDPAYVQDRVAAAGR